MLGAWDALDDPGDLRRHPQFDEFLRVRGEIARLNQIRLFNQHMGTHLLSLADIPTETVAVVVAWATNEA